MKLAKSLLLLALLGAIGFTGYAWYANRSKPQSPYVRMASANPVENFRSVHRESKSVTPAVVQGNAVEAKRAAMETRFTDLKEEGRRMREALMASDPKAAEAYRSVSQSPEYRQRIEERHKIEAAWATAPDGERDGMLAQMNSLREQTVAMIMMEINRVKSQPAEPPRGLAPPVGSAGSAPGAPPAPAAAPAPPIVFQ